MRISKISLQGFRAFKESATIECGPLTTIVGKNDSGKSSVLHALEIFFNGSPEETDFNHDQDPEIPISIKVSFCDLPKTVQLEAEIDTDLAAERLT